MIGSDLMEATLLPGPQHTARVTGRFHAAIHRRDGRVDDLGFFNGVTNLGFNLMLDSTFRSASMGGQTPAAPVPTWYLGLISNASYSSINVTDTMASHSGWLEDSTHYTPPTFTGAVNNGGGYSSGVSTMTINGVSQAIAGRDPVHVAGNGTVYSITSTVGGSTPTSVTFTPTLSASAANSAVITFGNSRPTWVPAQAASKSITNTSSVNFAMNNDNTIIQGIFVTSDNTLGGTAGFLWSAGLFGSAQTLFNGDSLKITYTVSLS